MTVKDMVLAELKRLGADGLCCTEIGCGCGVDDLSPCGCDSVLDCIPARRKIAEESDVDENSEFEVGDEVYLSLEERNG